jgi:hypothetical protein
MRIIRFFLLLSLLPLHVSAQHLEGRYVAFNTKCSLELVIKKDSSSIFTTGGKMKRKSRVKVISDNAGNTYLDFEEISCMISDDTLYLQNSGNALNNYWHFKDCDERVIYLAKVPADKLPHLVPISKNCQLGFRSYNTEFGLYQQPYILQDGIKKSINNYSIENFSSGELLAVSPNKQFIVLDNIIKGYVEDGVTKQLYENYLCVIVDVRRQKVVWQMQSDCSGRWNADNEWVSGDKVIFSGKP